VNETKPKFTPDAQVDMRGEPEVLPFDREKEPILTGANYVENVHLAVGFASNCWDDAGVFDTGSALRVANELSAYVRVLSERTPLEKAAPDLYVALARLLDGGDPYDEDAQAQARAALDKARGKT